MLQGGAAFTAGYVVLVLARAMRAPPVPLQLATKVSRLSEFSALGLALLSLLLGVAAVVPAAGLPAGLISNPLAPKELLPTLLVVAGGFALAAALARRPLCGDGPWRRLTAAVGTSFENADALLRRWPTASLALITLAAAFGWLLHTGNPA